MSENVKINSFFKNIVSSIEKSPKDTEQNNIYESVKIAKKEWHTAQNIFNNVSDPELVDFAIYNMEAAEKKYVYLMKRAKEIKENTNHYK